MASCTRKIELTPELTLFDCSNPPKMLMRQWPHALLHARDQIVVCTGMGRHAGLLQPVVLLCDLTVGENAYRLRMTQQTIIDQCFLFCAELNKSRLKISTVV